MAVLLWSVLICLVVYDLRENRIPNKVLLILILIELFILTSKYGGILEIPLQNYLGFLVCLSIGLVLYATRVLAAGDVKLMSILCFLVGLEQIGGFFAAIVFSGFVLSIFSLLSTVSRSEKNFQELLNIYVVHNIHGRLHKSGAISPIVFKMPFAPAIVSGFLLTPYIV